MKVIEAPVVRLSVSEGSGAAVTGGLIRRAACEQTAVILHAVRFHNGDDIAEGQT